MTEAKFKIGDKVKVRVGNSSMGEGVITKATTNKRYGWLYWIVPVEWSWYTEDCLSKVPAIRFRKNIRKVRYGKKKNT